MNRIKVMTVALMLAVMASATAANAEETRPVIRDEPEPIIIVVLDTAAATDERDTTDTRREEGGGGGIIIDFDIID